MKKILVSLFVALLLLIPSKSENTVSARQDNASPTVKTQRIFTLEGKDFDLHDCFINRDELKGKALVIPADNSDIKEHGTHKLQFVILEDNKPMLFEEVEIVTLSKEEYEDCISYIDFDKGDTYTSNVNLADLKGDGTTTSAYALAKEFIGMGGTCLDVAYAFTRAFLGERFINFDNYREVTVFEAAPGDIIHYQNGGIGYEHWAIYLGGNLALQGNYNGTTSIGYVYLDGASEPEFRRLY